MAWLSNKQLTWEVTMEAKSFVMQMLNFFGRKDGQTVTGFKAEINELTEKDRADFTQMLNDAGFPVQPAK